MLACVYRDASIPGAVASSFDSKLYRTPPRGDDATRRETGTPYAARADCALGAVWCGQKNGGNSLSRLPHKPFSLSEEHPWFWELSREGGSLCVGVSSAAGLVVPRGGRWL